MFSRTKRSARRALAILALFVATACSGREEVLVTIVRDAAAPEITTCTPSRLTEAEDMGLDLQVVVDHSQQFGSNQDDWTWLIVAFSAVFALPEFRGIGVGLTIYPVSEPPPPNCICSDAPSSCGCLDHCECKHFTLDVDTGSCTCDWWWTSCSESAYTPLAEISPLRGGLLQLEKLVGLHSPPGFPAGVPALRPALLGSLQYRNQWEKDHFPRRITQLLIAGTSFDGCAEDDDDHFEESQRVLAGADKPKTYVATFNESENDYDQLARAGRTGVATRLRTPRPPAPPTPELTDLFRKIRDTEGRCEYLLPESPATLDYRTINLTSPTGTLYPRVRDAAACERTPNGWYYDAPIADRPTRILTCPDTCKDLHGPSGVATATAQIQFGCPTISGADGG